MERRVEIRQCIKTGGTLGTLHARTLRLAGDVVEVESQVRHQLVRVGDLVFEISRLREWRKNQIFSIALRAVYLACVSNAW